MKSIVFSHQASKWLSENYLNFPERDELFQQLHFSLEFIFRTSKESFHQYPLKIDHLRIIFELEADCQQILIVRIYASGECC
jgi:hypothetical protein